jgi:hypothetical protein
MRRISQDSWLAIGLLVILVVLTIAVAVQNMQKPEAPPLSSFSNAPDGSRALQLWLAEVGFDTLNEPSQVFSIPEEAAFAFILKPASIIQDEEWKLIDEWVEAGGTLLLAGDGLGVSLAVRHFDFDLLSLSAALEKLAPQTALFSAPSITGTTSVSTRRYLRSDRWDYVTHLASGAQPVLVSFHQGEGRVILCASAFPFSNAGLKEPGDPELALNLLATTPRPGPVWFDEWHHGIRATSSPISGPTQWLRRTPAGQALLFVAFVALLTLVLRGRQFGRPVPLERDIIRRAPSEYITALANLSRRAGHRNAVLNQYHQRLKRRLGQRYRISPALPDQKYVSELARARPDLDPTALLNLLARLKKANVSENEMLQLAREASEWMEGT